MAGMHDAARRRWLLGAGACAMLPLAGCASMASPEPRRAGGSGASDVAWINRLTWGLDGASLAAWQRGSRRDFVQAQLHPRDPLRLPPAVQAQIDALRLASKPMTVWVAEMEQRRRDADAAKETAGDVEAKRAAQQAYQQDLSALAKDAGCASLLRALYSPNQLQEQLTWFWFNHFNVHQYKSNLRAMVGDYEGVLRKRALGRFGDLLIASATHPAMVRYLDNEQNAANRINENYAREVMELHSLGVDGGYTQKDVQELARVLTGLGVNLTDKTPMLKPAQLALYRREGLTEFNPARHDMGTKQVLGRTVEGRGWDEILDELGRLARHPATARHVSRRLAMHFASDEPAPALVDRMSAAYARSEGDIAITLEAMFDAPGFAATLGTKFKDPVHYVVSAVRLAYDGRTIVNAAPMLGWIQRLGEGLYNKQTPDGYPLAQSAWTGSGQMNTRFEIARTIGNGSAGLFRTEGTAPVDTPAFPQLSNASFHDALAPTLGPRTQSALAAATSPQEWNVLLLSSPEFQFR